MNCPRCGSLLAERPDSYYCENRYCNIAVVNINFKNLSQELRV